MGVIHKITVNRLRVESLGFVKLAFTKSGNPFAKLSSMDRELISPKFGWLQNLHPHLAKEFGVTWVAPEAGKYTRISRKDLKLSFVIKKTHGVEFYHTGP